MIIKTASWTHSDHRQRRQIYEESAADSSQGSSSGSSEVYIKDMHALRLYAPPPPAPVTVH